MKLFLLCTNVCVLNLGCTFLYIWWLEFWSELSFRQGKSLSALGPYGAGHTRPQVTTGYYGCWWKRTRPSTRDRGVLLRQQTEKALHKKTERGSVPEILMRRLPFSAAAKKFIFQTCHLPPLRGKWLLSCMLSENAAPRRRWIEKCCLNKINIDVSLKDSVKFRILTCLYSSNLREDMKWKTLKEQECKMCKI